jgi:hypothetical protein
MEDNNQYHEENQNAPIIINYTKYESVEEEIENHSETDDSDHDN